MIIIGFTSHPLQSADQMVKRTTEIPRVPDYIKGKGNYSYVTHKGGAQSIQIYEFDDSKYEEAFDAIGKSYRAFYDIPGFKFELRMAVKTREAVKKYLEST